jgi:hypothetical protein
LRNELSGLLRPAILSLLADAKKNNGKIFAALYELNDPGTYWRSGSLR